MRSPGVSGYSLLALLILTLSTVQPAAQQKWSQCNPSVIPRPRWFHALADDVGRRRVVLFSGFTISPPPYYNSDTWEWNGTAWVQCSPAVSPPARQRHAMAYDVARKRVVLFGGGDGTGRNLNDTWEWDGTAWVQRLPAVSPPARLGHAMAYDVARQCVVLFGGYCGGTNPTLGDTWEWDGKTWKQCAPPASPSARHGHAVAYDTVRGRVVLFGGHCGGSIPILNDTWEWNGTAWTQRSPATSPAHRTFHALVYNVARRRMILFGGQGFGNSRNDLWEWDGNDWSSPSQAPGPPLPRWGHAMAYDVARQCVVLFGGDVLIQGHSNDTWEHGYAATVTVSGLPCIGGTVSLGLSAPGDAGRPYQVGSSLGSGPIWIGSRALGLSPDGLLQVAVSGHWPAIFRGYRGILGPAGNAVAAIRIPTFPVLVGSGIHSAFLTLNPGAPQCVQSISNAASFMITK